MIRLSGLTLEENLSYVLPSLRVSNLGRLRIRSVRFAVVVAKSSEDGLHPFWYFIGENILDPISF